MRASGVDYVITVHDLRAFHPEFASALDQRIITENVAGARAIICSWPHPYADVCRLFPQHADKVFMIPLPVFNPPAEIDPFKATDRLAPLLLYPAGLSEHKNHQNLLRAISHLPSVRLVCTGPAPQPNLGRLQQLVSQLGLTQRVSFTGYVTDEELQQYFAECDAVILPTRWEAASGPLFEALARRKPIIVSDISPIRAQLAFAGAHAELFNPESPEDIAAAVRRWQRGHDPDYSELKAWIWYRDWSDVASEYMRIFAWVRGGRKPNELQPKPHLETTE
jgi:glycosyltransferase involved in cell wall biosynthesis